MLRCYGQKGQEGGFVEFGASSALETRFDRLIASSDPDPADT